MSFQPEIGSISSPDYESLKLFLSKQHLDSFPSKFSNTVDIMWDYHKYEAFNSVDTTGSDDADKILYDHVYEGWSKDGIDSEPDTTEEWCIRASIIQYEQYRALFEGFSSHQWTYYAAVLMWKSSSPWPALRGALYDYYLRQTGGFYGIRKALSDPVHVQLDALSKEGMRSGDRTIRIINKTPISSDNMSLKITGYDINGKFQTEYNYDDLNVEGNTVYKMSVDIDTTQIYFTQLQLYSSVSAQNNSEKEHVISNNIYWKDNTQLLDMPAASVNSRAVVTISDDKTDGIINLNISNNDNEPAVFMLVIQLNYGANAIIETPGADHRILPTQYSDNYITLFGGEHRTINLESHLTSQELIDTHAEVLLQALNMEPLVVRIESQ